jgi:hypothetical protein
MKMEYIDKTKKLFETADEDNRMLVGETRLLPGASGIIPLNTRNFKLLEKNKTIFGKRNYEGVFLMKGNRSLDSGLVGLPIQGELNGDAIALGAVEKKGRVYWNCTDGDSFYRLQKFMPFIAKSAIYPMSLDLIPGSSFGSSLSQILKPRSWSALRQQCLDRWGGYCQCCGSGDSAKGMDCHEVWEYHEPIDKSRFYGVQKLVGFLSLCSKCHMMFHQGYAQQRGMEIETSERIMIVNRWSLEDYEEYCVELAKDHAIRSEIQWVLDISMLEKAEIEMSKLFSVSDDGFAVGSSPKYQTLVKIVGAGVKVGDVNVPVKPVTFYPLQKVAS